MLRVSHIDVFYRRTQALWDVSFFIEKKEIVIILGANGAGKSTTLKTIAGIIHPPGGTIELEGVRLDRMPPHRIVDQSVAFVPEGGAVFPKMTISENLDLGAYNAKARQRKRESLEWVYEIFPVLREKDQKTASTLSGGERQMLAIARGMMIRPKLFMLDEPSYGLAPLMVAGTFKIIKQLPEYDTTVLVVEQSSKHALRVGDRGYVLENGRIVLCDTCCNLKENDGIKKSYLGL